MEPQYYDHMVQIQSRHWWYEGRRSILAALIADLTLPPQPRILEAGCGTGANTAMLQKFGTVEAFEPFSAAREHAHKTTGLDIKAGALPADIPFEGSFDLIGAFDVIEHIDEDSAAVKALYNRTKEGGYAVFTVPAFPFLWSEHDEVNHHKRRYVKDQLAALLEEAGYQIKLLSYYNTFLFPVAVAVRFGKKLLKKTDQPDVVMPNSDFVNQSLCRLFSLESTLLKRTTLPFGVSLIAIGRKERGI